MPANRRARPRKPRPPAPDPVDHGHYVVVGDKVINGMGRGAELWNLDAKLAQRLLAAGHIAPADGDGDELVEEEPTVESILQEAGQIAIAENHSTEG